MGPNGIGKSTLLSSIAGLLSPIDGLVRRSAPENELAIRAKVTYLADHPWLPKTNTGREILHAEGTVYGIEIRRLSAHIDRLLALFQLEKQGDTEYASYSNGQKKKLAVATALVTEIGKA
ncbi:MAG: ATP-binding cassette domain-containing protein [Verrucomicrobiales bacterium]